MRAIFFSDLHLSNWSEFSRVNPQSGLNTRMLDGIGILRQIRTYCVQQGIDLIVFGGDMFHSSKKIEPDFLELWVKAILEINEENIKIMAIPGQHDHYAQNGIINTLAPFRHLFHAVMDSVDTWPIPNSPWQVISCPNRKDHDQQVEDLQRAQTLVKGSKKSIFLGHFLVKEILEADGVNFDTGTVSLSDLPTGCDLYAFGDYHPHVWLPDKKLLSIGSTNHHTFGDKNRPQCGFLDLDLDAMTFKRIEVDSPLFITIGEKEDFPGKYSPHNFYNVIGRDQREEDKIRAKLSDEWNVKFTPVIEEVTVEDDREKRLDVKISMEPHEVVRKFVEYFGKDERFLRKGLSYLG